MPISRFLIFVSVFFLVMGLVSLYIYIRGLQAIPSDSRFRGLYTIVFWTIAASFLGGRLLESAWRSPLSDVLVWTGSFWIAAMLYFFLAALFFDVVRVVNHFLPFYPSAVTNDYSRAKLIAAGSVVTVVALLLLVGHVNALFPRIRTLDLTVTGKASEMKGLRIVAVSDIHLGSIVGRSRVNRIVSMINSLEPDVVLLPGDIVDEDLAPVISRNLGEALRNIESRFGVFAVTGNHEYIGGVEPASAYLMDHNIIMLRDQTVKVNDSFFLVGREDRSLGRFNGGRRKDLSELMKEVDCKLPVILMDHQPFGLSEAARYGIDLQLSGHTHYGQLWPVNYIVEQVYEVAWGYRKIDGTHYYVSNGAGTWGPPVRLGNRPEIVQIRLRFE